MGDLVRWDGFSADPRRAEVAGVRASDSDRDTAVDALREAFADGRLDRVEFDRRSAAALAATRLGELAPLLEDLEASVPALPSVHEEAVRRYGRETRDARNGFIGISTVTTGIWGITSLDAFADGTFPYFWPAFPMFFVGAGWLLQTVRRGERIEHHERKIAKRRRRRAQED